MTQKEKLIELIGNFTDDLPVRDIRSVDFDEKFADFLLENGVVVQPCKIGDTLWRVFRGSIEKYVVSNVMYRGLQRKWQIDCMPFLADAYDDFGKTVFLDRKEAEAALKRKPCCGNYICPLCKHTTFVAWNGKDESRCEHCRRWFVPKRKEMFDVYVKD